MKVFFNLPFVIIFCLALLIRIQYLDKELALEEALNVKAASKLNQSGYPLIYVGEQTDPIIYLDRPPGIHIIIAAFFKIFGTSEQVARWVPLILSLGQLSLIYYFTSRFFVKKSQKLIPIFSILLFAIHPYVIQNSLQIHFDGMLSFFTTFYLLLALNKLLNKKNELKDHLQLGFIFFLSMWFKYDPTLMATSIIAVFSFFVHKKFFIRFLLSSALAAIIFFATFYTYNVFFQHPEGFFTPLNFIAHVFNVFFIPQFSYLEPGAVRPLWADNYYLLIRILSWLSIPLLLLLFYSVLRISTNKLLRSDPKIIFMILWFGFYFFIYLILGYAGDYPRYFAPAMPPMLILVSIVLTKDLSFLKKTLRQNSLFFLFIILTIIYLLEKNQLLFKDRITGWVPSLQIPFFLLLASGFLIIFLIHKYFKSKTPLLLTILIVFNIYQVLIQNIHDLKSQYSLTNFYGYGGYRQTGNYLKAYFKGKDVIILTFDPVAYYWNGRFLDYALFGKTYDYSIIMEYLKNNKIAAIALPSLYLKDLDRLANKNNLDLEKYLSQHYAHFKNIEGEKGINIYY